MISPVKVALIAGLMVGYEFDVAQFISREILEQAVGGEKVILASSCLLTKIFLKVGVPELPDIDQYIELKTTTDLGLIKDAVNPMTRQAK